MSFYVQNQAGDAATRSYTPVQTGILQRACACRNHTGGGACAACREKREHSLQRAAIANGPASAPPIVQDVLRSPGQPLDSATRAFMEPRFDHDFSQVPLRTAAPQRAAELTIGPANDRSEQEADLVAHTIMRTPVPGGPPATGVDFGQVRVHTGPAAARSAAAINARAYTVGRDIVFGAGQYAPNTMAGRQLLAHELAHTIQQTGADGPGGAAIQRAIGDGHDLAAERFAGDALLEAVFDGERILRSSERPRGDGVRKIQQALLDLEFALPEFGADGVFGGETETAVRDFQRSKGLSAQESDGRVGPQTMALLDNTFAGTPPTPTPPTPPTPTPAGCADGTINQDKDALPAVPPPSFKVMSAPELLELVKKEQPPGQPVPKRPPLGATKPSFSGVKGVTAKAIPTPDATCMKCVAEWDLPVPEVQIFLATGSFSDEPKRFWATQEGDASGCPSGPIPDLKEVRKVILSEAMPFIVAGELEHWTDFQQSFLLIGNRYLSNMRRLTPERTHLRGKDQAECVQKVGEFLDNVLGLPLMLLGAGKFFISDFNDKYLLAASKRDAGPHNAEVHPPESQRPFTPNIDVTRNPFLCEAFWRKFDAKSFSGIPGASAVDLVKDTNDPPKQPWHQL
jgi:hypothetical protein